MSLRNFLDAGYALLLEDALRIPGVLLEQAMEMVNNAFASVSGKTPERPVETEQVVAQNEQSMAQLNAMMARVKR